MTSHTHQRTLSPYIAMAALASLLTACGGGSSDNNWMAASAPTPTSTGGDKAPDAADAPPTAQPTPEAPSKTDSTPCTNEADFHAGTTKDATGTVTTQGLVGTSHAVDTVGQRQAFAGANPIVVDQQNYDLNNNPISTLIRTYVDLIDGNVISYGGSFTSGVAPNIVSGTTTYDPPLATPVTMQPGQVVDSNFTQRMVAQSTSQTTTIEGTVAYSLTYVGRETLSTPLGSFDTCHFIVTTTMRLADGSVSDPSTTDSWRAAEGPYRGQLLKSRSATSNLGVTSDSVVTQMTYSPQ